MRELVYPREVERSGHLWLSQQVGPHQKALRRPAGRWHGTKLPSGRVWTTSSSPRIGYRDRYSVYERRGSPCTFDGPYNTSVVVRIGGRVGVEFEEEKIMWRKLCVQVVFDL